MGYWLLEQRTENPRRRLEAKRRPVWGFNSAYLSFSEKRKVNPKKSGLAFGLPASSASIETFCLFINNSANDVESIEAKLLVNSILGKYPGLDYVFQFCHRLQKIDKPNLFC